MQANPDDPYVWVNAAWRYLSARDYERAIAAAERAENHPDARAVLGFASLSIGDTKRAIEIFESDIEDQGRLPSQLSNLAVAYYQTGRESEGQELLAELETIADTEFFSPALLSAVYFAAGDVDRGFVALQRAVEVRVRGVIFLRVYYMLDGLRDDPRYVDLLRDVGFSVIQ